VIGCQERSREAERKFREFQEWVSFGVEHLECTIERLASVSTVNDRQGAASGHTRVATKTC
jgi:hypothetical protein